MNQAVLAIVLGTLVVPALAQMTPAGVWRTIDDKTGEVSSEVRIADNAGVLSGRIEKLLRKDAKQDSVCDKCTDERKTKRCSGWRSFAVPAKPRARMCGKAARFLIRITARNTPCA